MLDVPPGQRHLTSRPVTHVTPPSPHRQVPADFSSGARTRRRCSGGQDPAHGGHPRPRRCVPRYGEQDSGAPGGRGEERVILKVFVPSFGNVCLGSVGTVKVSVALNVEKGPRGGRRVLQVSGEEALKAQERRRS